MRIKLNWLKELVDISDLSTKEIVDTLSLYSIEVESVFKVLQETALVIGHIIKIDLIQDSNHLSNCKVDIGNEILQIVCGAPNVKEGQKVIVAKEGAILAGGLTIKRTQIRGVESNGMICSLDELGLEKKYIPEEYQNGIFYFKEEVKIGESPYSALSFDDDVIELGVTPNRGDLLSMLGVAIEVSAVLKKPYTVPSVDINFSNESCNDYLTISSSSNDCISYYGLILKDLKIAPSPWWMISRLIAFGIRPINNVVDITNYVLALFGQPLHAFDYDKLGNKIEVRKANDGERIITLDGEERLLIADDLLITDGKRPVAIAGVMGGMDTAIDNATKTIVLEAAVFDPSSVSKTYRRLDLRSDSSIRFEKGVDVNRTKLALDYAAYLLQNIASAQVLSDPAFVGVKNIKETIIPLNAFEVNKVLGTKITQTEIEKIYKRLGFTTNKDLSVLVPNRRADIKLKQDLIEEIGRIYGYHKLPSTLPTNPSIGQYTDKQKNRKKIKDILVGLGLNQLITYSLTGEENFNSFTWLLPNNSKPIELLNPITSVRKYLRTSLIPSLIENARYCNSHKIKDMAIYELGKIYYRNNKHYEYEHLAILMSKQFSSTAWQAKEENVDFFLLKSIGDTLFKKFNIKVDYLPMENGENILHPRRSAYLYYNDKILGYMGELHPKYAASCDLDEVYVLEVSLSTILEKQLEPVKYKSFSKYPYIERDIAVIVGHDVLAGEVVKTVKEFGNEYLQKVDIFDVYSGEQLEKGKKSIALKMIFSANHPLLDTDINLMIDRIVKALEKKYQAILRDE